LSKPQNVPLLNENIVMNLPVQSVTEEMKWRLVTLRFVETMLLSIADTGLAAKLKSPPNSKIRNSQLVPAGLGHGIVHLFRISSLFKAQVFAITNFHVVVVAVPVFRNSALYWPSLYCFCSEVYADKRDSHHYKISCNQSCHKKSPRGVR
jgi:hypothetical protein